MVSIEELMEKYRNMDDVDRQKLWLAVIGTILLVYLLISLESSMDIAGQWLDSGAKYANDTIEGTKSLS